MVSKVSTRISLVISLALLAVLAVATLSLAPKIVSADHGDNSAQATFTKWVIDTDFPVIPWDMTGVVGGKVGEGTFTGEVLYRVEPAPGTAVIYALYHINGGKRSFTALLQVTQTDALGTAVIEGVVTEGWREGARVEGEYTVMPTCPMATPGNIFGTTCFQGRLRLR